MLRKCLEFFLHPLKAKRDTEQVHGSELVAVVVARIIGIVN